MTSTETRLLDLLSQAVRGPRREGLFALWLVCRVAEGVLLEPPVGDQVLVVVRIEARGGGSGVPVAEELAVLWTFEGDRAVEARSFTSRDEALDRRRRRPH